MPLRGDSIGALYQYRLLEEMLSLNFPTSPKQFGVPLFVAVLSLALFALEPTSSLLLEYHVDKIRSGEWFRLITGHFLHTNAIHLTLNLVGFLLIWALHGEHYKPVQIITLVLYLSISISLCMWYFSPNLHIYVGLSAMLHGIFAWGIIHDIHKKMFTGYLLAIGLFLKIASEQISGAGALMPELIESRVAIDSHMYGAIAGMIAGTIIAIAKTIRTS